MDEDYGNGGAGPQQVFPARAPGGGSTVVGHQHHRAPSTIVGLGGPPPQLTTPPPPPPMSTSGHTTVTVTTEPGRSAVVTEINLNIGYFRTLPGYLKLVQLVFGIVCLACGSPAREYVGESYGVGHNHWFLFVVATAFIVTLLWCFFYFLQIRDSVSMNMPFSWLRLEYYYTVAATLLYLIAFIVLLVPFGGCAGLSTRCDTRTAAGVFGLFNTLAYGLGAYILHNDYKATPPELQ